MNLILAMACVHGTSSQSALWSPETVTTNDEDINR